LHFIVANIASRRYNVICFAARVCSVDMITLPEQDMYVGGDVQKKVVLLHIDVTEILESAATYLF
jgi:hypothetical protein